MAHEISVSEKIDDQDVTFTFEGLPPDRTALLSAALKARSHYVETAKKEIDRLTALPVADQDIEVIVALEERRAKALLTITEQMKTIIDRCKAPGPEAFLAYLERPELTEKMMNILGKFLAGQIPTEADRKKS